VLRRSSIAYCIAEFNVVHDQSCSEVTSEIGSNFKSKAREKLIGVEVIEETSDSIVIQCLRGYSDLPVKRSLERMGTLSSSMLTDALRVLVTSNSSIANEVVESDNEVDRLSHFVARELNLAISNRIPSQEICLRTLRDCPNYRLAAKSIERIAGHSLRVAHSFFFLVADATKDSPSFPDRFQRLSKPTSDMYEAPLRALFDLSQRSANENILKSKRILRERSRLRKKKNF
jgi:phosphate uptake regulator